MSASVRLLALFAALVGAIAQEWQLIGENQECQGTGGPHEAPLNTGLLFSLGQCKSECLNHAKCEYIAYSESLNSCKWQYTESCKMGLASSRSEYNLYQLCKGSCPSSGSSVTEAPSTGSPSTSRSGGSPSGTSPPVTDSPSGTSPPVTKKVTSPPVISKLEECWRPVAICDKPAFNMEECAAATYTVSQTDTKAWEVCAGVEVGAQGKFVSATVKAEVCGSREGSEEIGKEIEVKVPGEKGATTVACAQGVTVRVSGRDYLRMTIRRTSQYNKCPEPKCPGDLAEVRPDAKDPLSSSSRANWHGIAVAVVTCLMALLR